MSHLKITYIHTIQYIYTGLHSQISIDRRRYIAGIEQEGEEGRKQGQPQQAGCTNPTVQRRLPMMTTRNASATATLVMPYRYACRRRPRPFSSATQVLTVVVAPQKPSMMPWRTWQLVCTDLDMDKGEEKAPMPAACCRSKHIPRMMVPKMLTANVPSGKAGTRAFRYRET